MLEFPKEYVRPFNILCFKDPDYVMKVVASWMTLDELEVDNMKRSYKGRDGQSLVKKITYWKPFGFQFRYHHQVEDPKNICHYTI